MDGDDQVTIEFARLIRQTDKAGLFEIDGDEVWLPWSQLDEGSECESDGDTGALYLPQWLAEEKGLNYV